MKNILLSMLLVLACKTTRNTLANNIPTFPPPTTCEVGTFKCENNVPYVCRSYDEQARWYPTTPLNTQSQPAVCAVCVIDGTPARAHCQNSGVSQ